MNGVENQPPPLWWEDHQKGAGHGPDFREFDRAAEALLEPAVGLEIAVDEMAQGEEWEDAMTDARLLAVDRVTDLLDHEEWEPHFTGRCTMFYHHGGDRLIRVAPDGRVEHERLIHMG